MQPVETLLGRLRIRPADHLPIVAAFCRRIGLMETVNRVVPTQMAVDVGTVVQGMVLDTLSGRSPLYRLDAFIRQQDTELLLGRTLPATAFNDTTVARAMDALFAAGAATVFGEVAFQAAVRFPLDLRQVHFDTTSVNVWGDYAGAAPDDLRLTYGHSKDHRPDLKQFLLETLCVHRNIPILGGCADGNASDKTRNHALLTRLSAHLARHGLGEGDFLYVADAAMVTQDNLVCLGANRFVTRLPFTYHETERVVTQAVAGGVWESIGALAQTATSRARPAAVYRCAESQVTLYGTAYRAVVVHSSAHDQRRQRRLQRQLNASQQHLQQCLAEEQPREYFCRADAEAAAARLAAQATELQDLAVTVVEHLRYAPGRPPKNRPRPIAAIRYRLRGQIQPNAPAIQRQQEQAGCFVLLTNVPRHGDQAYSAAQLLHAYKDQHGIERNFSFLKDPLIVNDLFLKKPQRIEVLGAILLIALLVWNLIEHAMRQHLEQHHQLLPGWDNKPTRRPTAFMMSTKFAGLQILQLGTDRRLAQPLSDTQRHYLSALHLTEQDLLCPHAVPY